MAKRRNDRYTRLQVKRHNAAKRVTAQLEASVIAIIRDWGDDIRALVMKLSAAKSPNRKVLLAEMNALQPKLVKEMGPRLRKLALDQYEMAVQGIINGARPKVLQSMLVKNGGVAFDPSSTADEVAAALRANVFPPLKKSRVERLLKRSIWGDNLTWEQRLKGLGRHSNFRGIAGGLATGISKGENVQELSKRLADVVDGPLFRARRIARTESLRVAELAQRESLRNVKEFVSGMQIIATLDDKTRDLHRHRNGRIYKQTADGLFVADQFADPPLQAGEPAELPALPDEPNSVIPGQFAQGRVVSASRAFYDGQVTELVTATGRRCTVTANHHVATSAGFMAAGVVHEGSYLLSYIGKPNGASSGSDNIDQPPSRFEDVFASLDKMRPSICTAPTSVGYLDGKRVGWYRNIDAVTPEWELSFSSDSILCKQVIELPFVSPNGSFLSVSSEAGTDQLAVGRNHAGTRPTSLSRYLVDVQRITLKPAFCRIGPGSYLDASLDEPAGQRATTNAAFARNLIKTFAGTVFLDQVVKVRNYHWRGHVFDLQTSTGYMVANCRNDGNGIIVSNCRCFAAAVFLDAGAIQ